MERNEAMSLVVKLLSMMLEQDSSDLPYHWWLSPCYHDERSHDTTISTPTFT